MGQEKWNSVVPPGSRAITGPKIVVIRNRDNRYGRKPKPIPVDKLPLDDIDYLA